VAALDLEPRHIDLSPVKVPINGSSSFTVPIESKWVEDGLVLEGRYGRGIMTTKSILDPEHRCWVIPAPLLACLLAT